MMTDQPKPVAAVTLEGLDLASLLCSRVCHDVISPVGAIVNGIELYDSGDASMKEFSIDLVRKSSRQASARLQFARLAFGAAGSAGAMIDTGDAGLVANAFFADEKINLVWEVPRALLPKNQVKLILNLVMVATHAIPRGGSLTVAGTIAGEQGDFVLTATGINARMPHNAEDLAWSMPMPSSPTMPARSHRLRAWPCSSPSRATPSPSRPARPTPPDGKLNRKIGAGLNRSFTLPDDSPCHE
jgi:histidine phosphotransferase ChpT